MNLPRVVVINAMDKERADHTKAAEEFESIFGVKPVALQIPIGRESSFRGVVDLLSGKARIFADDGSGKEKIEDIPGDMADEAEAARDSFVESIAESDDELLEKYLEGHAPEDAELSAALRKGIMEGNIFPLVYTSAVNNWGTETLSDVIFDLLPSPADRPAAVGTLPDSEEELARECSPDAPFSARIFKTIIDPYAGKISLVRVFSGVLKGDSVYNSSRGVKERFGQVAQVMGKSLDSVNEVGAGDMGAITKLKESLTGETLSDEKNPVVYPEITFPNPVISMAVEPKSKGDEDKLSTALGRIREADVSLRVSRDPQTGEMIVSTMGQQHVDVVVARLKRIGVEVNLKEPKVPYRETIIKTFQTSYRHKKQTGGAGQFAEVHLRVEPRDRDTGFEYGWEVFGGAISSSFQTSIEKGIRQVLNKGPVAGYPVVDVKAVVFDGKEHPVDSKDIAFQIAGREVFKMCVSGAGPKLLEPIMALEIVVPDDCIGDVMGDLNSRRGRVGGVDGSGGRQIVRAQVPLAEILRYATDLTSMTGGRGQFSMELDHYEEVPAQIADKIVAESRTESDEEKKA
jgi:elongation factor G